MPKPFQRPRPPICVPSASPNSRSPYVCGQRGWGPVSSALIGEQGLSLHWYHYRQGCRDSGLEADPRNWRIARSVLVAASDEEARVRAFSPESSQRNFFGHFFKIFRRNNLLAALCPDSKLPDSEITVDSVIESRLIYGSPVTVAAKLARLRKQVGPFGTLLVSGMDWTGPNAAWERESLSRLAQEVLPLLRKQIAIDEAA